MSPVQYIFNRENPQNSETKNGPRRGLDFIALILSTNPSFVIEPIEKVKTKSASFRKKRCGSLDWNCCFDYNWMGSRAQRVEYS